MMRNNKNQFILHLIGLLVISLTIWSNKLLALEPTFTVNQELDFGIVLPEVGSCRMNSRTGVITSYIGLNVCVLNEDAQYGLYTIVANPNKIISVKILPNQDNGDGIIFNPSVEMVSEGFDRVTISNNVGAKTIDSGPDGIVNLYLGGDLQLQQSFPSDQTINFSFLDAIEWSEEP